MSRDVVVDQSAAAMLNYHKHIQQTKDRGNGNEEIAGNDPAFFAPREKRVERLIIVPSTPAIRGQFSLAWAELQSRRGLLRINNDRAYLLAPWNPTDEG
jgi:hypothetical protein